MWGTLKRFRTLNKKNLLRTVADIFRNSILVCLLVLHVIILSCSSKNIVKSEGNRANSPLYC